MSSSTSGELSDSSADLPPGGASVQRIAASLESRTEWETKANSSQHPPPSPVSAAGPESQEGSGLRRRVQSECIWTQTSSSDTDQGVKSDSEEEESKGGGLKGSSSPHNSSSECIPFAEEGNLTIKQRPKAPGPPRAEAVLEPPEKPLAKNVEVPEFHLKESDTVKRRHKLRDKEQDRGCSTGGGNSWKSHTSLESPATGPPIKPLVSPKPPVIAPKPVRHSLLAAQGKIVVCDLTRDLAPGLDLRSRLCLCLQCTCSQQVVLL